MLIEVADTGLGITEADMRVANTRLQSGGEVTPFTARHMGLFVVGRLASQHGLVVRLRSTISGQPDSGTTAGVFVKAELLARGAAPVQQPDVRNYEIPDDPYGETAAALAFVDDPADYEVDDEPYAEAGTGRTEVPVSLLPQRNPGFTGISGIPATFDDGAQRPADAPDEPPVPEKSADILRPAVWQTQGEQPSERGGDAPPLPVRSTNGTHPERSTNGTHPPVPPVVEKPPAPPKPADEPVASAPPAPPAPPKRLAEPPVADPLADEDTNSIFDKMLSEWLIDDPVDIASSADLDWKTVWDHGWSVAATAEEAPVSEHTPSGLPVREPGARLVPGAADDADSGDQAEDDARNGGHRNGGAPSGEGSRVEEAEGSEFKRYAYRDPEAVRSTIGSHFGGVHAGRADAREARGTEEE
jgi:hypothetical protein